MRLSLPASAVVDAAVFDVRGARVRTIASGLFLAGNHMIGWDGRDEIGSRAAPGIYFARIATGNQQVVRKIQLVR
jgi:flagellar hook assembly protein FlgD